MALFRLWRSLARRDLWWAEVFGALALIIWAIVNIASPRALSEHNFWPLLQVAPEVFWERASLVVATMQLMALAADIRWARALAAFFATWLVGALVLNLMHTGFWPPGAIGFYIAGWCTNMVAIFTNVAGMYKNMLGRGGVGS